MTMIQRQDASCHVIVILFIVFYIWLLFFVFEHNSLLAKTYLENSN